MNKNNPKSPWWNADGVDSPDDEIHEITVPMLDNANFYKGKKLVAKRRNGVLVKPKNKLKA